MKENIKSIIAVAIMTLCLIIVSGGALGEGVVYADSISGEIDSNLTWSLDGNVLTISGEGAMRDYSYSPDTPWKDYYDQINSLVIESGVTEIGKNAFRDISTLESVSFPASLTKIYDNAFYNCTGLREIELTSNLTFLGDSAFGYCSGLEYVLIDTRERTSSFSGSVKYGKVFFSDNIADIHITQDAVISEDDIKGLAEVGIVTVEDGRTDYATKDGVIFDPDMTELIYYPKIKQDAVYTVPDSVTSIGQYAFQEHSYLRSIDLGNVENIGYGAFYRAQKLEELYFPASVKSVGTFAFAYIESKMNIVSFHSDFAYEDSSFYYAQIGTLEIGDSVTALPIHADVTPVDAYSVDPGNEVFMAEDGVLYSKDGTTLVAYPSVRDKEVIFTVPSRVTRVEDNAFANGYNLHSKLTVVLPDELRLEYVGENAFYGCTVEGTLHMVGDYYIGEYAFAQSTVETAVFGDPEDDGQTLEEGYTSEKILENGIFSYCKSHRHTCLMSPTISTLLRIISLYILFLLAERATARALPG